MSEIQTVQRGPGFTEPPLHWAQCILSLGKANRQYVECSPSSREEIKNVWSCTCTPLYAFMAWSLQIPIN